MLVLGWRGHDRRSAVLFLCWIELESGLGGAWRLWAASSLCIAFVVGFLLIVGPAIPSSCSSLSCRAHDGSQAQRADTPQLRERAAFVAIRRPCSRRRFWAQCSSAC
ncbi:MAG: hypothetical protein ACLT98_08200 [Eggerthellaceae bacterium]